MSQERAKECKYKECRDLAAGSFALVPLCSQHEKRIRSETDQYYKGYKSIGQRKHFRRIWDHLPYRPRTSQD